MNEWERDDNEEDDDDNNDGVKKACIWVTRK